MIKRFERLVVVFDDVKERKKERKRRNAVGER